MELGRIRQSLRAGVAKWVRNPGTRQRQSQSIYSRRRHCYKTTALEETSPRLLSLHSQILNPTGRASGLVCLATSHTRGPRARLYIRWQGRPYFVREASIIER